MSRSTLLLSALAVVTAIGCAKPNTANIALRKRVQVQQDEIDRLTRTQSSGNSTTAPATSGPTIRPLVSAADATGLFTTHGIRFGRLLRVDGTGLTIHVVPTDDDGNDLKAAGAIHVTAWSTNDNGRPLGDWSFTPAETRRFWNGTALRYEYVVPCPAADLTAHGPLSIFVTFTDALTGRSFQAIGGWDDGTFVKHGG